MLVWQERLLAAAEKATAGEATGVVPSLPKISVHKVPALIVWLSVGVAAAKTSAGAASITRQLNRMAKLWRFSLITVPLIITAQIVTLML